jgi:hypothetical protein|tara:strand:+ start:286 stop:468 length:183 start_codon:yes stop_codon:yes gene_type:complete
MQKQKDPKVIKKQSYANKGDVDFGKTESVSVSNKAKPGMGKGKARGMGAAEFGGKFSGIY